MDQTPQAPATSVACVLADKDLAIRQGLARGSSPGLADAWPRCHDAVSLCKLSSIRRQWPPGPQRARPTCAPGLPQWHVDAGPADGRTAPPITARCHGPQMFQGAGGSPAGAQRKMCRLEHVCSMQSAFCGRLVGSPGRERGVLATPSKARPRETDQMRQTQERARAAQTQRRSQQTETMCILLQ